MASSKEPGPTESLIAQFRASGLPLDGLLVLGAGDPQYESPGMRKIREVVEASESLSLDSSADCEILIERLAIALGFV